MKSVEALISEGEGRQAGGGLRPEFLALCRLGVFIVDSSFHLVQ